MVSSRPELISRKFIKPSFSTTPPLGSYKLGLFDQLINDLYIPVAFFYPNKHNNSLLNNSPTLLENSLSKVLASYYPLAGRVVNNLNVDLNDMGATLIEARVHCKMSEISSDPDVSTQDVVFPSGLPWKYKHSESLIVAQLTHFDCGGIAISLCLSHKVADGLTLCNFARDWAELTKHSGDKKPFPSPQLEASTILPPIEERLIKPEFGLFPEHHDCVTKRFIFNGSKLRLLKVKVSAETGITYPTHVEVVTALLHKCAYAAASMVDPDSYKFPIFIQVVNMRPLINPPVSSNSVGNLANYFGVPFPVENNLTFTGLASDLRGAKLQFYYKYKGITTNEFRQEILNSVEYMKTISEGESNLNQYICSSMCGYPFYNVDFGWGNPERVTFAASKFKNYIVLLDDQNGDGIEALVPLEEKVMNAFERDPELLQFASIGSSFSDYDKTSVY